MAPKRDPLPRGVFPKGRWYYRVRAEGAKRVWIKLSLIADGLPALFEALAKLMGAEQLDDRMPALIAAWKREVMPRHAPKTRADESRMLDVIADSLVEFKAGELQAPDASEFLAAFRDKPRSFNAYRGLLRELMRFAIEKGHRRDNPLAAIRTMPTPARTRYITDSELRRIKVGGIYGDDGKRTRSGLMLAALIDVAYLTGQRIGDLLELRWKRDPADPDAPHVSDAGLRFRPAKTRGRTGAAVTIGWTPALREVVDRIRALQAERLLKKRADQRKVSGLLFTSQDGTGYTYWGASSAWRRAVRRAGVKDCHFHDLRAKALTDVESKAGMQAARRMGSHATEGQTADYVRARAGHKVGATR